MANLPTFVIQYPMSGVRYSENYSYICHADNQQTSFKKVFSHVLCGKCGSFQNRRINEQHSSLYDPKWLCHSYAYTLSYECGVLERYFCSGHTTTFHKINEISLTLFFCIVILLGVERITISTYGTLQSLLQTALYR